ncbi:glycosyltransferase [uncultured Thiodictyon sp.]|jgi:glycosyltransferase involved in cell wall biosynthesis|uniref:glycosyltransferase n=1 Tax=uncultured Thiodictyon sp. TaxID=1846217 RepID=UPI0025EAF39C|nr:glycosyltransferase [uncultured Thiodictyon sp.]
MSISILLLTLNEEANLPPCLAAVNWSDDVVVLDSFSQDNSVDVADRLGARGLSRAEAQQRMNL